MILINTITIFIILLWFIIEATLCQAALTCIAACISIQPDNTQVYLNLSSPQPPVVQKDKSNPSQKTSNNSSWLVTHCLQRLALATKGLLSRHFLKEYDFFLSRDWIIFWRRVWKPTQKITEHPKIDRTLNNIRTRDKVVLVSTY